MVLEVPETGFEEVEEEEPLALLDQADQVSCAEAPVAATARAAEAVNFILIVLCQVVKRMTGFLAVSQDRKRGKALRPQGIKGKEWKETS